MNFFEKIMDDDGCNTKKEEEEAYLSPRSLFCIPGYAYAPPTSDGSVRSD
jgi:hypothetical protein